MGMRPPAYHVPAFMNSTRHSRLIPHFSGAGAPDRTETPANTGRKSFGPVPKRMRDFSPAHPAPAPDPRPLLGARGERAAPESCRAGHLRASSPSRSAVRHGLVGARLRRPATGLARPPPGAFPRSPRAQAKCRPADGSLAAAAPSPPAAGPARASIPRLGARMRRMPAGPRPRRLAFAASPPASGLPIHRNLRAPPLAVGDCASSARALAGLPGGVGDGLRFPASRPPAKRRGEPREEAAAAIEEGGEGKGAAGGASPKGVRVDARSRGRRTRGRAPPDASPRRARAPETPDEPSRRRRREGSPLEGGWGRGTRKQGGCREAEGRPDGMQGDADGGRGLDWRLPATPAASHAPVWRGVAPAEFRAQDRAAKAGGAEALRDVPAPKNARFQALSDRNGSAEISAGNLCGKSGISLR